MGKSDKKIYSFPVNPKEFNTEHKRNLVLLLRFLTGRENLSYLTEVPNDNNEIEIEILSKREARAIDNILLRSGFSEFGVVCKLDRARQLLLKNRIGDCLKQLDELFNNSENIIRRIYTSYDYKQLKHSVELLYIRFHSYKEEVRKNLIDRNDHKQDFTDLTRNILTVFDQLQLISVAIHRMGMDDNELREQLKLFDDFMNRSTSNIFKNKEIDNSKFVFEIDVKDFIFFQLQVLKKEGINLHPTFSNIEPILGKAFEQEEKRKIENYKKESSKQRKLVGSLQGQKQKHRVKTTQVKYQKFAPQSEYLDLSKEGIFEIDNTVFLAANVKGIDLSDNFIKHLPKKIRLNTSIEGLDLSNNQLQSLSSSIGKFPNLEFLNLNNNLLETLPNAITELKKLKVLLLNGNNLEKLPSGIGELTNLEVLHLSRNNLRKIPDSMINLIKLKTNSPQNRFELKGFQIGNNKVYLPYEIASKSPQEIIEFLLGKSKGSKIENEDSHYKYVTLDTLHVERARWVTELKAMEYKYQSLNDKAEKEELLFKIETLQDRIIKIDLRISILDDNWKF